MTVYNLRGYIASFEPVKGYKFDWIRIMEANSTTKKIIQQERVAHVKDKKK
jgi:hypothetical protein